MPASTPLWPHTQNPPKLNHVPKVRRPEKATAVRVPRLSTLPPILPRVCGRPPSLPSAHKQTKSEQKRWCPALRVVTLQTPIHHRYCCCVSRSELQFCATFFGIALFRFQGRLGRTGKSGRARERDGWWCGAWGVEGGGRPRWPLP